MTNLVNFDGTPRNPDQHFEVELIFSEYPKACSIYGTRDGWDPRPVPDTGTVTKMLDFAKFV